MADRGKLTALVEEVARELLVRQWQCVTAESCTGGGIAEALTDLAGSSDWFERGFVTYSDHSKQELLGVSGETIERHGAVSEETARQMAEGALRHSRAQAAMAVTGIAGPAGGTLQKPVGTVVFAWAMGGFATSVGTRVFEGDRQAVREAAVEQAIEGLLARLRRA
ncbi:MAG: Nicotinamide-nucleotide amidohydrolase PncC [Gammaproteobacteria bacterium]|nr:Nicotinamide-nucleotide amidohydrolase PncC [Gammaproteobacteria bacterium]